MIVFDVIVDGSVKETIQPKTQKLREIHDYLNEQMKLLNRKYGYNVFVKRRIIY
jgi:hypothetical protein